MALRTLTTALLITGAAALAACGGPKTTDQLLLGEWDMAEPVTTQTAGQTITMRDGEIEYKDDGTTEGEMVMEMGGLAFKIESTGTYVLNGMTLTEKTTGADVTVVSGGEQAQQIVNMIQQGVTTAPEASMTITAITKDKLTLTEPTSNTVMVFDRD